MRREPADGWFSVDGVRGGRAGWKGKVEVETGGQLGLFDAIICACGAGRGGREVEKICSVVM